MGSDTKKTTPDIRGGSLYMSPRAKQMFRTTGLNPIQNAIDKASEAKMLNDIWRKGRKDYPEKSGKLSSRTFVAMVKRAHEK